jgi:hypothetical protein
MGRKWRALAYWTALLISSGLLSAVLISIVVTYLDFRAHGDLWNAEKTSATILSYGGRFIGAFVVFSAVFFGWRKDRIEAQAFGLKNRDLEIKLRDLGTRLVHAIVSKERQPSENLIASDRLSHSGAPASLVATRSFSTEQPQEPSHDETPAELGSRSH